MTFTLFRSCSGALLLLIWTTLMATACERDKDEALRDKARAFGARAIEPVPEGHSVDQIELGRALFFDRELSGNRDTSCASCHHPAFAMADGRALSVGAGSPGGLGPERELGLEREFAPRNAPTLLNVHDSAWRVQFWDGRVEVLASGEIKTPSNGSLPSGLESVIAAQAAFPVASRDEMRGARGDRDARGQTNELAEAFDSDHIKIWGLLTARIMRHEGYRELTRRAYPELSADAIHYAHLANAMAAFQLHELALTESGWDRFLRGDDQAMTPQAKRGAALFFGPAGCARCHSGALLTDQRFYHLAVPQLGPGKGPDKPLDRGHSRVSMDPRDDFAFRTPSLRHVADTAPYMHNGAYATLEAAIRHHVSPAQSLREYDPTEHLSDPVLVASVTREAASLELIAQGARPSASPDLSETQVDDLISFLEALSDPDVSRLDRLIPSALPSGLPVERAPSR